MGMRPMYDLDEEGVKAAYARLRLVRRYLPTWRKLTDAQREKVSAEMKQLASHTDNAAGRIFQHVNSKSINGRPWT